MKFLVNNKKILLKAIGFIMVSIFLLGNSSSLDQFSLFKVKQVQAASPVNNSSCKLTLVWQSPTSIVPSGSAVHTPGTYTVIGTYDTCLQDSARTPTAYLLICANSKGPTDLQSCPTKDSQFIFRANPKGSLTTQVDILSAYQNATYTAEIKINDADNQLYKNLKSSITYDTAVPPPGPIRNQPPLPATNNPANNVPGPSYQNYDAVVGNLDNPIKTGSLVELIFSILRAWLVIVAILAVAVIVYGGIQMIISAGNEKLVTSGKRAVTWAILGLIVALLSFSIVSIVENFIGVKPPGG